MLASANFPPSTSNANSELRPEKFAFTFTLKLIFPLPTSEAENVTVPLSNGCIPGTVVNVKLFDSTDVTETAAVWKRAGASPEYQWPAPTIPSIRIGGSLTDRGPCC